MKRASQFCLIVLLAMLVGCGSSEKVSEPVDRPERTSLRGYHGAPPVIPHDLTTSGRADCASCHGPGQQVAGKVVAPVTPHPTWTECTQCHVARAESGVFVANTLTEPLAEPVRVAMPSPFLPPYIPHRLDNFREQACETCHIGPGAPLAQRPGHGPRTNCRQCHVPNYSELAGIGAPVPEFKGLGQ